MGIVLSLLLLTFVIWLMAKLKDLRENPPSGDLPNDEATMVLGLFYTLSGACLRFYKDKGRYPSVVSGARDGLDETGYLRGTSADGTSLTHMFTIIANEQIGYALCLYNVTPMLAKDVLDRVEQSGGALKFREFSSDAYHELPIPITSSLNLALPLPHKPSSSR